MNRIRSKARNAFECTAGQLFGTTRGYQVAGAEGIEPPTFGFGNRRSTN